MALSTLAREIGDGRSAEEVADGFIKIAVENMANAIKKISVQRGYDVTRYALNCFGGAGGQHACLVADALGMTKVLIHPFSSLLSAYGMGLADVRATRQQAIEEPFGKKAHAALKRIGGDLGKTAKAEVAGQGVPASKIDVIVRAHIRYAGTDTALVVNAGTLAPFSSPPPLRGRSDARRVGRCEDPRSDHVKSTPPPPDPPPPGEGAHCCFKAIALKKIKMAFERAHKARFGFVDRKKELVIEAVSVEAIGGGAKFREQTFKSTRAKLPSPARATKFFSGGKWHKASVYTREQLSPGHKVNGPAIIVEPHQTIVVEARLARGDHGEEPSHSYESRRRQAAKRDRHQGRSGDAGSVQQPVHVDCRADGSRAAEHRVFGQHQGAARFLLRGVFRRGLAGRERAAHAGASGLDGSLGRNHHPGQSRTH